MFSTPSYFRHFRETFVERFSESSKTFSKFDTSLEPQSQIILNDSDVNIIQPELEVCTKQGFRVIQIRNAISSYLQTEYISPINLNKETKPLSVDLISPNNLISKLKTPSQTENRVLLTNQTFNTKIKGKSRPPRELLNLCQNLQHNHHLGQAKLTFQFSTEMLNCRTSELYNKTS